MLWVGAGITLFFVLLAILAPLISPYALRPVPVGRPALPAARGAFLRAT